MPRCALHCAAPALRDTCNGAFVHYRLLLPPNIFEVNVLLRCACCHWHEQRQPRHATSSSCANQFTAHGGAHHRRSRTTPPPPDAEFVLLSLTAPAQKGTTPCHHHHDASLRATWAPPWQPSTR